MTFKTYYNGVIEKARATDALLKNKGSNRGNNCARRANLHDLLPDHQDTLEDYFPDDDLQAYDEYQANLHNVEYQDSFDIDDDINTYTACAAQSSPVRNGPPRGTRTSQQPPCSVQTGNLDRRTQAKAF